MIIWLGRRKLSNRKAFSDIYIHSSQKSRKGRHLEKVGCDDPELDCEIFMFHDELVECLLPVPVFQRYLLLDFLLLWLVLYLYFFIFIDKIFLFSTVWGFSFHFRQAFPHVIKYSRSSTLISAWAEVDQSLACSFNSVSIRDREIDSNAFVFMLAYSSLWQ